jgi:hypothetical protein
LGLKSVVAAADPVLVNESFVIELSGRVNARCRSVTARRGSVLADDGWVNARHGSVTVTGVLVPAGSAAAAAAAVSADALLGEVAVGKTEVSPLNTPKDAKREGAGGKGAGEGFRSLSVAAAFVFALFRVFSGSLAWISVSVDTMQ